MDIHLTVHKLVSDLATERNKHYLQTKSRAQGNNLEQVTAKLNPVIFTIQEAIINMIPFYLELIPVFILKQVLMNDQFRSKAGLNFVGQSYV